jgi:hypothetical protein
MEWNACALDLAAINDLTSEGTQAKNEAVNTLHTNGLKKG